MNRSAISIAAEIVDIFMLVILLNRFRDNDDVISEIALLIFFIATILMCNM